ncbi:hypothetical protein Tco_1022484, partial [Tanacetum coccineum]
MLPQYVPEATLPIRRKLLEVSFSQRRTLQWLKKICKKQPGGPRWDVPMGRRDSLADMSSNMHGMLKFWVVSGSIEEIFKFETPKSMSRNLTSYIRDDELGHQTRKALDDDDVDVLDVLSLEL